MPCNSPRLVLQAPRAAGAPRRGGPGAPRARPSLRVRGRLEAAPSKPQKHQFEAWRTSLLPDCRAEAHAEGVFVHRHRYATGSVSSDLRQQCLSQQYPPRVRGARVSDRTRWSPLGDFLSCGRAALLHEDPL